jgi:predicted N-formylglutamate amidohydrolase
VTRLLIDQNRSATNRNLFSRFSRPLSQREKTGLVAMVYEPYHHRIERWIQNGLKGRGSVFHLAIHSFTPVLRGRERNADLGLLYDPASRFERRFARALRQEVLQTLSDLRIRYNYPYRGAGDGLTTSFRAAFGSERYGGIEIEINQKWSDRSHLEKISRELGSAIKTILSD